jgi:gliding motility-associated-like protein
MFKHQSLISTLLLSLIALMLPPIAYGGNGKPAGKSDSALRTEVNQWMNTGRGLRFLENKGQMADMQGKALNSLLFKTSGSGADMYITTSGLSYVFTKIERHKKTAPSLMAGKLHKHSLIDDSITEQYCRADMELVGADIQKENIVKEGESEDRTDYYLGGICPNGLLNVRSYDKVTIKNIYPGIDWVLFSGAKGLKYNFIVHPGANPSLIRLKYKWTNKPELQNDGSVKISTPMGTITEGIPESYEDENRINVPTTYTLHNGEIQFKVNAYNTAKTLIIDPTIVWGTYYRGNLGVVEDVEEMQEDGTNVWITGWNVGFGFPTLNPGGGAYCQSSMRGGGGDAFILQFSVTGVLKWATYYGGNGADYGNSIYSDGANVWVTGMTNSTNLITLNPGGGAYFQGAIGDSGRYNAFILKFSTAGLLEWATYYGGSTPSFAEDYGYSIQSDGTNVWVTGEASTKDFPTLNPGGGAYFQALPASGSGNAFILQFNTSGVLKWATFYGGNGTDRGLSIYSDGISTWVTGFTESTTFPTLNPGGGTYYQGPPLSIASNAFVLQFSPTGVLEWGTYFGGNGEDGGNSINSDGTNVWLTGYTSSTNFPILNPGGGAYFQGTNPSSRYGSALISQFTTSGILKWSTYYGGSIGSTIFGMPTLADGYSIQNDGTSVWVCGGTTSPDFPTYTNGCGFFQDTLGTASSPPQDVFILQFSTSGVREWATYYGIDNEDDASLISSDGTNLFVAGDALHKNPTYNWYVNTSYPMVNPGGGAYFADTIEGEENVFIGKFCIACLSPLTVTISPPDTICSGSSTVLNAIGAAHYNWSPSSGLSATNIANPVASPTVTTTYTVTATGGGPCTGTVIDSVKVTVDTLSTITLTKDTTICKGDSIQIVASGGATYLWNTGATTSSIDVKPLSYTLFTVDISRGKCTKKAFMYVTVKPVPSIHVTGTTIICNGDSTLLTASGGLSYKWNNGATTSSIKIGPGSTTTYSVSISNGTCAKDTSITVTVNPIPIGGISGNIFICAGTSTTLSASGGTSYIWNTGETTSSIMVSPIAGTTYSVTIIQNGCADSLTAFVSVNAVPVITACCDSSIIFGQSVQLASTGGGTYNWSPPDGLSCNDCSNPLSNPMQTTTYTLTITSDSGCISREFITIDVNCGQVFVPTAFSPNGDGQNDILYVKGPCIKSIELLIFDRWGNKVFESTDINNGWDGKLDGLPMNTGTYVYFLTATMYNDAVIEKKGNITLVR